MHLPQPIQHTMTRASNAASLPGLSAKRRSTYGKRQSHLPPPALPPDVSTTNKRSSFHITITDRIKYRPQASTEAYDTGAFDLESLTLFTRHTWNLYRVSSLFVKDYRRAKLKQYAARIKQELVKQIKDAAGDVSFDAKVSVLPIVKAAKSQSLKIEVFLLKGDDAPALKYKGIILRWDEDAEDEEDSGQLPLVLCIGSANVVRTVHATLVELFDTVLSPIRISEEDLMWLSAMLSDTSTRRKEHVHFDYGLHKKPLKNPITVSIPSSYIRTIWNNMHATDTNEITVEEVEAFHKCIRTELTYLYGIKFDLLKLNRVTLPGAIIGCEGKVKIQSEEATAVILTFISDLAVFLHSPCLAMAVPCTP